jgi:hypothetical protein
VVYCARPEDWTPGLSYIPLAKITAILAMWGLFKASGAPSALQGSSQGRPIAAHHDRPALHGRISLAGLERRRGFPDHRVFQDYRRLGPWYSCSSPPLIACGDHFYAGRVGGGGFVLLL